jgi:hypothetical protein
MESFPNKGSSMKRGMVCAAMWLTVMVGCAVESQPGDPSDVSSSTSELSSAQGPVGGVTANDVTCNEVWECDEICGTFIGDTLVRYSTNVLHKECSDGSDTVMRTDACGEGCF